MSKTEEGDLDLSDLSDKEDAEQLNLTPFSVEWFTVNVVGCDGKLGISSLPGCKYKQLWRSLSFDIKCLKENGVQDVFCLCTKGELHLYRVQNLIEKYTDAGFTVHHYPIEDSQVPSTDVLMKILEDIHVCLMNNKKTLIHCYGGFGRSCFVAMCLLIFLDDEISSEEAREKIKQLRGEGATGSIKQYNYVNEFQEVLKTYKKINSQISDDRRSVSR